jgi:hypothetical protein
MRNPCDAFPVQLRIAPRELKRDFLRFPHTYSPEPQFHFELVLPKSWQLARMPAATQIAGAALRSIALFRNYSAPSAEVEIIGGPFARDISPADWLDVTLERRGETVLARRDAHTRRGVVPDVLTCGGNDLAACISRWLAIKDGPRMFLLRASVQKSEYSTHADAFYVAVSSLRLLHSSPWPLAERLKTFSRARPDDFLLLFPESWELTEQPSGSSGELALELTNRVRGDAVGQIVVGVIDRSAADNAAALVDRFVAGLQRASIQVDPLMLGELTPGKRFEKAWRAAADGRRLGMPFDISVTIGQRPSAWFVIGHVGPARTVHSNLWAINRRAYAIVTESLRTTALDPRSLAGR